MGKGCQISAAACLALAAQSHQEQALSVWSDRVLADRPAWIFVGRCHDSTPLRLKFGGLQDELSKVARYGHKDKNGKYHLLSMEQYLESVSKTLPRLGTIEVMAQSGGGSNFWSLLVTPPDNLKLHCPSGSIAWCEELQGRTYETHTEQLRLPVRFLSRNNGSTIFAAWEQVRGHLKFSQVQALTTHTKWVVVFVGSDLCAAGMRAKHEMQDRCQAHNIAAAPASVACRSLWSAGVMLMLDGQCVAHVLHREIEHIFNTKELIAKLFATAFCSGLTGMAKLVKLALVRIIREDSNGPLHFVRINTCFTIALEGVPEAKPDKRGPRLWRRCNVFSSTFSGFHDHEKRRQPHTITYNTY